MCPGDSISWVNVNPNNLGWTDLPPTLSTPFSDRSEQGGFSLEEDAGLSFNGSSSGTWANDKMPIFIDSQNDLGMVEMGKFEVRFVCGFAVARQSAISYGTLWDCPDECVCTDMMIDFSGNYRKGVLQSDLLTTAGYAIFALMVFAILVVPLIAAAVRFSTMRSDARRRSDNCVTSGPNNFVKVVIFWTEINPGRSFVPVFVNLLQVWWTPVFFYYFFLKNIFNPQIIISCGRIAFGRVRWHCLCSSRRTCLSRSRFLPCHSSRRCRATSSRETFQPTL
jgi:hypothetical protein